MVQGYGYSLAAQVLRALLADKEFRDELREPVLSFLPEEYVDAYKECVPNPMDLGTMVEKLKQGEGAALKAC